MAAPLSGNVLLDAQSIQIGSATPLPPTRTLVFCHSVASQLYWTADRDYNVVGASSLAANYVLSFSGITLAVIAASQKAIADGIIIYRPDSGSVGLNCPVKNGQIIYCETAAAQRVNVLLAMI